MKRRCFLYSLIFSSAMRKKAPKAGDTCVGGVGSTATWVLACGRAWQRRRRRRRPVAPTRAPATHCPPAARTHDERGATRHRQAVVEAREELAGAQHHDRRDGERLGRANEAVDRGLFDRGALVLDCMKQRVGRSCKLEVGAGRGAGRPRGDTLAGSTLAGGGGGRAGGGERWRRVAAAGARRLQRCPSGCQRPAVHPAVSQQHGRAAGGRRRAAAGRRRTLVLPHNAGVRGAQAEELLAPRFVPRHRVPPQPSRTGPWTAACLPLCCRARRRSWVWRDGCKMRCAAREHQAAAAAQAAGPAAAACEWGRTLHSVGPSWRAGVLTRAAASIDPCLQAARAPQPSRPQLAAASWPPCPAWPPPRMLIER